MIYVNKIHRGDMNDEVIMLKREIEQLNGYIATLDQENRQMRARNERLEAENKHLEDLLKAR